MPNGHGVPLGCVPCRYYQKSESNPLRGRCQCHGIETHMDLVCADFDNRVNDATHSDPLEESILYAYVDVVGYGYPPPTELIPLAQISEYKNWDEKQIKQAWGVAQEQAQTEYNQRK